jgi:uncharacterized repeat protein (TIGR03803 family)
MSTQSAAVRSVVRSSTMLVLFAMALIVTGVAVRQASAQTFTVLHTFSGNPDGTGPFGGMVADRNGNYYGTTETGGVHNIGSVFEMSPPGVSGGDWTETIIWSFAGGADGSIPSFQLAMDARGRLYGETQRGGDATCNCGTVFALVPPKTSGANWAKRVLYMPTTGAQNGNAFYGGLVLDSSGSLYGTQFGGGTFNEGLAFKITPTVGVGFTMTTLYDFGAVGGDSDQPWGPLTMDLSGNLYGTSLYGGTKNLGTVFRLTPPTTGTGLWSNSILHSFSGGVSGCEPEGNVILDGRGRLYGQTTSCGGTSNNGLIFRLTPPTGSGPWVESVLHTFSSIDGGGGYPSLSFDAGAEVFYGTSFGSGGYGLVFQLTPPPGGVGAWDETVLHTFTGGSDGGGPLGPIVWDANGVLYGTGFDSNAGFEVNGVAFSIAP